MNSQDSKVGTQVTARDLSSGEQDSCVIHNDYVVTTDGTCRVDAVQWFANGTHIITIKGRQQ